jgi:hypothetical protein
MGVLRISIALVAASIIALGAVGCGDEGESTTSADVVTPAPTTVQATPEDGSEDKEKSEPAQRPDDDSGTRTKKRTRDDEKQRKAGGPAPVPEGCPLATRADCKALAGIVAGSSGTPTEACPASLTEAQCEAIGEELGPAADKDADAAKPGKAEEKEAEECPTGLTEEQCQAAGADLGSG